MTLIERLEELAKHSEADCNEVGAMDCREAIAEIKRLQEIERRYFELSDLC